MQVCYTWNANSREYRNTLNSFISNLHDGSLLPFFGAGVSYDPPSNIPLGGTLRQSLINGLIAITKNAYGSKINIDENIWKNAHTILSKVMLEKIFGGIYEIFGDESLNFWRIIDQNHPNANHRAVAFLARKFLLSKIITLNFDNLFEIALQNSYITFKTHCTLDEYFFSNAKNNAQVIILKPHGSMADPNSALQHYKHIVATIQKIGNAPSIETENEIVNLLRTRANVFFAGYSDDDIDITPIFLKHQSAIQHIYWFNFMARPSRENGVSVEWQNSIPRRLLEWFDRLDNRVTIISGNLNLFFKHVLTDPRIGLKNTKILKIEEAKKLEQNPDTNFLSTNPTKTALSLAHLLEWSGERKLSLEIYRCLERSNAFRHLPQLEAFLLSRYAWGCHAGGDLGAAISLRKKARKVLFSYYNAYKKNITDIDIELGYDFWSLVKKAPNPRRILNFAKLPLFFLSGLDCFRRASRRLPFNKQAMWIVSFYYGDFWHYIAKYFILITGNINGVARICLNKAFQWYEKALKLRNLRTSFADFYYLRYCEIMTLLQNIDNIQKTKAEIIDARHTFELIQDDLQIGQADMVLSLLFYVSKNKIMAIRYLVKAKTEFHNIHEGEIVSKHLSGLMDIAIYERLMGRSLVKSVKKILSLLKQHRFTESMK